jgi:hypothetical protein
MTCRLQTCSNGWHSSIQSAVIAVSYTRIYSTLSPLRCRTIWVLPAARPHSCPFSRPSLLPVLDRRQSTGSKLTRIVSMALVTASGPLGLSAFFPPAKTTFTNPPLGPRQPFPKYLPPPHLPLTPTWHEADFSLASVLSTTALPGEEVDLRLYTQRLLSRYIYMSGKLMLLV